MSYCVETDGKIIFADSVNMGDVYEIMYSSSALSYYSDKHTVEIESDCWSYHHDDIKKLLIDLSRSFEIVYGKIIIEGEDNTNWIYVYDKDNRKWNTKVSRCVESADCIESNNLYTCTNCGFIHKEKYNYCSNCGAFVNLDDEEKKTLERRTI